MHPSDVEINDYVDGSLEASEQKAIEQHLSDCATCRQLADDLRLVMKRASSLELREPPARAWTRIERAIQLEPKAQRAFSWSLTRQQWAWLSAAAALVVATLVGVGVGVGPLSRFGFQSARSSPSSASSGTGGDSASTSTGEVAQSVEVELQQAEQHYEKAIKGLEQIANAERGTLDPNTAATLQKNLAVIDQAISESRAAVRAEPTSEPAQTSLIESFKAKIGLLQDTVALINETRKGNEAGAARIVSGLKRQS
ncbi:MAG TPA: zf-HC2 domain-containing protein [Vicinamibacterales bacterium]|nr:zf-HC2 domain-containing protein [Vicinamibacterales bacterium]